MRKRSLIIKQMFCSVKVITPKFKSGAAKMAGLHGGCPALPDFPSIDTTLNPL
jgi:hypothetical protein